MTDPTTLLFSSPHLLPDNQSTTASPTSSNTATTTDNAQYTLANSPEHPEFNTGASLGWGGQDGTLDGLHGTFDGFKHGVGESPALGMFDSHSSNNSMNMFNLDQVPSDYTAASYAQPSQMLSHTSSTSSLTSLSSDLSHTSHHSLYVDAFPPTNDLDIRSHSRQSSLSFEKNDTGSGIFDLMYAPTTHTYPSQYSTAPTRHNWVDQSGVIDPSMMNPSVYSGFTIPNQSHATGVLQSAKSLPKLEVETRELRRMGSRARSMSRAMPYQRSRGDSISSIKSEDEDIAELMSSSTTQSQTPWSTLGNGNSLTGGLTRMTLHHRRTSSNTSLMSPLKPSPSGPRLSRKNRSSSLLLSKRSSDLLRNSGAPARKSTNNLKLDGFAELPVNLAGTAAEKEMMVRKALGEETEKVNGVITSSAQDKARSLWVKKWLQLSYNVSAGFTVPRQGLYHSYEQSCRDYGIRPINPASFGKAVRSAFVGIRTRRLGVRGNSKYHYVSLRPAIGIEAERLNAYGDSSGRWHEAPEDGSMGFQMSVAPHQMDMQMEMDGDEMDDGEFEEEEEEDAFSLKRSPSVVSMQNSAYENVSHDRALSSDFFGAYSTADTMLQRPRAGFQRRHTTSALDNLSPSVSQLSLSTSLDSFQQPPPIYTLPGFPNIHDQGLDVSEALRMFWNEFCTHLEILRGCVRGLQLDRYEINCRTFWGSLSPSVIQLCQDERVSEMVSLAMAISYDDLISLLLNKMLEPLPMNTTTTLRNLAREFENIMENAMANLPKEFSEGKVELAVRVGHLMERFLDIHQITTALLPILSTPSSLSSMLQAWDNLNLKSISDQCALSCNCDYEVLERILDGFRGWLVEAEREGREGGMMQSGGGAVERLRGWVERLVKEIGEGMSFRALIQKAGFITSQITRDFTLRSEPSFGLFQLLKTWIDDYISLHILRRTALLSHPHSPIQSQQNLHEMSVLVPPCGEGLAHEDLSTAVPFDFATGAGQAGSGRKRSGTDGGSFLGGDMWGGSGGK